MEDTDIYYSILDELNNTNPDEVANIEEIRNDTNKYPDNLFNFICETLQNNPNLLESFKNLEKESEDKTEFYDQIFYNDFTNQPYDEDQIYEEDQISTNNQIYSEGQTHSNSQSFQDDQNYTYAQLETDTDDENQEKPFITSFDYKSDDYDVKTTEEPILKPPEPQQ